ERMVEKQGKTVLMATHNLDEAELLSDCIAIIHQGSIRACGALSQMKQLVAAQRLYSLKFIAVNEQTQSAIKTAIQKHSDIYRLQRWDINEKKVEVVILDSRATIAPLIETAVLYGVQVVSCTPLERSLQDIFERVITDDNSG
ncbi:MAG: hypothetical protein SCK70_14345, partial [bacterium]|nr:hypothetical protein [bacterium]